VSTTTGTGTADRAVRSRVSAGVAALLWPVVFYGITDLLVVIAPAAFPEGIAWAVCSPGWVGPQITGIATALLLSGVAAAAWGQVLVAFLVAACGAFPRMWRRPRWSLRLVLTNPAFWPVGSLSRGELPGTDA
jgi:hypothetical protein